jgi:predicted ArsR family transcriptional regulator
MDSLTDRQREILDEYIQSKKFVQPTVRQVAKEFKISVSNAQEHMQALRRKGHLPEPKRR